MPLFVTSAYEWCDQIAFEHELDSLDMRWLMNLPAGEKLEQKLPQAIFRKLRVAWPDNHRLGMLRNQALFFVVVGLSHSNIQFVPGVKPMLIMRAKIDEKPIHYLETTREFSNLVSKITDQQYVSLIETILSDPDRGERITRDLHDAWNNGDTHKVAAILPKTSFALQPNIRSATLDERNAAWIPKILEAIELPKKTLIAVEALHLVGESGLISLLNKAGYEVSPVI